MSMSELVVRCLSTIKAALTMSSRTLWHRLSVMSDAQI